LMRASGELAEQPCRELREASRNRGSVHGPSLEPLEIPTTPLSLVSPTKLLSEV
jgi:hypothetical protein